MYVYMYVCMYVHMYIRKAGRRNVLLRRYHIERRYELTVHKGTHNLVE